MLLPLLPKQVLWETITRRGLPTAERCFWCSAPDSGHFGVQVQVKQRWHLLKRNYDLYRGREQFAAIEGNFLAWEFVLRDENGGVSLQLSLLPSKTRQWFLLSTTRNRQRCTCLRLKLLHNKKRGQGSRLSEVAK